MYNRTQQRFDRSIRDAVATTRRAEERESRARSIRALRLNLANAEKRVAVLSLLVDKDDDYWREHGIVPRSGRAAARRDLEREQRRCEDCRVDIARQELLSVAIPESR